MVAMELKEEELAQVSGGEMGYGDWQRFYDAITQISIQIIKKFIPVMPSVKALNAQSLMQERLDDYVNGRTKEFNIKSTALKLMGVDLAGYDASLKAKAEEYIRTHK